MYRPFPNWGCVGRGGLLVHTRVGQVTYWTHPANASGQERWRGANFQLVVMSLKCNNHRVILEHRQQLLIE